MNRKSTRIMAALLAAALALSGCSRVGGSPAEPQSPSESRSEPQSQPAPEPSTADGDGGTLTGGQADFPEPHPYLRQLLAAAAAGITEPGMTEYDKARAAFTYLMRTTTWGKPIGFDLWRVHGGGDEPISYLEEHAISPLRFGVGECEDYAAALTLLLREMGLEAVYVPGVTYSALGNLIDHAWTMVRIDGVWYHLDSQLEDDILREDTTRFRYFLKGDATMSASHRWGELLRPLLTAEQSAALDGWGIPPACPQDYPAATPAETLGSPPEPDQAALRAEAEAEVAAYEAEHGPLPEMELNTVRPVFGEPGYGPPDDE